MPISPISSKETVTSPNKIEGKIIRLNKMMVFLNIKNMMVLGVQSLKERFLEEHTL